MTPEQEIKNLKKEIEQLKKALVVVYTEISDKPPYFLSNRINVMANHFEEVGINCDEVVAGTAQSPK